MTQWIEFIPTTPKPKTLVWLVRAKTNSALLGRVAWLSGWRRYCFFAAPESIFDPACLRDIANFCDRATEQHKAGAVVPPG